MQSLLQDIAQSFFKIEKWNAAHPIGKGNINETYLIDFQEDGKQRRLILQKLNTQIFTRPDLVHQNWQYVEQHLEQQDFPLKIPKLIAARPDGWRVLPFFENTFAPETAATPQMAYEAARAFGLLTRFLADFPAEKLHESLPNFHNSSFRWHFFLETLKKDPAGRVKLAAKTIEKMMSARSIFLKINELKHSGKLPIRATHNDTKAGNVLLDLDTERAVSVIDWDTWMPGTVLSDFGDMLRSFAPDVPESDPNFEHLSVQPAVVEGMVHGFLSAARGVLQPIELENLYLGGQWLIAEQALRFLTDYVAGDVYFKTQHPEQNLQRAENQLHLLRQVQFFERPLRRMIRLS